MALAVMAVVQIFRGAQCPDLIHREILGFSVSFNHEEVRLYGHYPVIDGDKTELYRTEIEFVRWHQNNFQDRWKTYYYVKNIYEHWAPIHFERLCRAIDKLNPNWTPSALGSSGFGTPAVLSESTEALAHFEIASTISTIRTTRAAAAMLPPLPRSKTSARLQSGDQENSWTDRGAPSIASSTEDTPNNSGKRGKKSNGTSSSQKRGKDGSVCSNAVVV